MEAINDLLCACLSSESGRRRPAENDLSIKTDNAEFVVELAQFACNATDVLLPQRQLALVTVKNIAVGRWAKFPRHYKGAIHSFVIPLVVHATLSPLAAAAIGAMALVDTSAALWPSLVSDLGDLIARTSGGERQRTIDAVGDVCAALSSRATLKAFEPLVIAISDAFLVREIGESDETRAAFHTLRTVILATGLDVGPLADAVRSALPVATRLAFQPDVPFLTASEAVGFLRDVAMPSAGMDGAVGAPTVQSLMACLERVLPSYLRATTEGASGITEEFHRLASSRLDLLLTMFQMKRLRPTMREALGSDAATMESLCSLLLRYSLMPQETCEEWLSDANVFLAHEGAREDRTSGSVRDVALDCVQEAVSSLGNRFVPYVMAACNAVLAEGPPSVTDVSPAAGWKRREAALAVIGHLLHTRSKALEEAKVHNCASLCELLTANDLGSAFPLLTLRALSVLTTVVRHAKRLLDPPTLQHLLLFLLEPCVVTVSSACLLVAVGTCGLLSALAPRAPRDTLIALSPRFFAAVDAHLRTRECHGEALYRVLETTVDWMRACCGAKKGRGGRDAVASAATTAPLDALACNEVAALPASAVACWAREIKDPNVGELFVLLFSFLGRVPCCHAGLASVVASWMAPLVSGMAEDLAAVCAVPAVIAVTSDLLAHATDPLATEVCRAMLSPLCQLLLTTEDSSVVTAAGSCFAAVLRRLGRAGAVSGASVLLLPSSLESPGHLPGLDEQPAPVPLRCVAVVATETVLSSERSDVTLLGVGALLDAVFIAAVPEMSLEETTRVVTAVATRVASARLDSVLLPLAAAASCLLAKQPLRFIALLGPQRCSPFFARWLSRQHAFYGRRALRTSVALAALLAAACVGGGDATAAAVMGGGVAQGNAAAGEPWEGWADCAVPLPRDDARQHQRRNVPSVPLRVAVFVALARTALEALDRADAGEEEEEEEDGDEDDCLIDGELGAAVATTGGTAGDSADDEDDDDDPSSVDEEEEGTAGEEGTEETHAVDGLATKRRRRQRSSQDLVRDAATTQTEGDDSGWCDVHDSPLLRTLRVALSQSMHLAGFTAPYFSEKRQRQLAQFLGVQM